MAPSARRPSESAVRRLSLYLQALEEIGGDDDPTISSRVLAERAGTTAAQVRKDLSLFGSFGRRGLGYEVPPLRDRIREILGLSRTWRVALVGAGRIGAALFEYPNFGKRGFQIVTILDADPAKVGRRWGAVTIRAAAELERVLADTPAEIAILAVPGPVAQREADRLVDSGVRAILNFAPVRLKVPTGVAVNDVNMAVELESLSFSLREMFE